MKKSSSSFKAALIVLFFILLSIFIVGLMYLSTIDVAQDKVGAFSYGTWMLIAYTAGLSMIILPCTLPLVFIVVPLCMGKGYKKGLIMAILFGLGLTITITAYGVVTALLGQFAGLDTATRFMWLLAGVIAFMFGLAEIKLLQFTLPAYAKVPKFIQEKGDYAKSLLMGLLLGNAGVGCPNPFFYVLLAYIASTGSVVIGGSLGVIHGIGRAIPLIMIAILAIVGVNISQKLVEKREKVEYWTGWGLVAIGAFILLNGLFGHEWWERSPLHLGWNKLAESVGITPEITLGGHTINYTVLAMLILLIAIPVVWYAVKKKTKKAHHNIVAGVSIIAILAVIGIGYYVNTSKPTAEPTGEVKEFNVTAFQWGFEPQFIEVEEGDQVILNIESLDVAHGLAIDEFGVNAKFLPGETVTVDFVAAKAGTYEFYCSVACGAGHNEQEGFLIVKEPGEPERELVNIESESIDQTITIDGEIDEIWNEAEGKKVKTVFHGAGKEIQMRSLHNGSDIFFLIQWQDPTQNNTSATETDRVAISLDVSGGADIAMGAAGVPHVEEAQRTIGEGIVDIWHWKAFDSHTETENVIDDEFAGPFEVLKEHYYRDDDNKYGGENNLRAAGKYDEESKTWTVEIARMLATNDANVEGFGEIDKQLKAGQTYNISFALWDGETETGGEHKTTDWELLTIQ